MTRDSLVSPGLLKSTLRRFWPLWLAGLVAFVLLVDVLVYGGIVTAVRSSASLDEQINQAREVWPLARAMSWAVISVASVVVAIAVNDHLFSTRAATFVGSLPLRRRTVFCTSYLAGLIPLLVVPALAAALMLPLRAVGGTAVRLLGILQWYLVTALLALALYSFAQLACQLSGTRAVAVLLYAVIFLLAICLETAVSMLVPLLMYGVNATGDHLLWLSPGARLLPASIGSQGNVPEWYMLAAYAVAGMAVAVGSCALFSRRDLETAGNSISFPRLRPVLRCLAGASMALLFSSVFCLLCLTTECPAPAWGVAGIALMLTIGGFLGVLFAEMIMRRSTHVLAACRRDALVLAVVSLAFVGACRLDLPGATHYVPEPSEVASVTLHTDLFDHDPVMTSPKGIAQACDLQRSIIAYGGLDTQQSFGSIDVTYRLQNGRTVARHYPVRSNYIEYRLSEEPATEGALLVDRLVQMAETDEGRASRFDDVLNDEKVFFQLEYATEQGDYRTVQLTAADRDDLVAHALRQDLMDEDAGLAVNINEYGYTPVSPSFDATLTALKPVDLDEDHVVHMLSLDERATPHLVAWVREHYPEITLVPTDSDKG